MKKKISDCIDKLLYTTKVVFFVNLFTMSFFVQQPRMDNQSLADGRPFSVFEFLMLLQGQQSFSRLNERE